MTTDKVTEALEHLRYKAAYWCAEDEAALAVIEAALASRAKVIAVPAIPIDPEAERLVDRLISQATPTTGRPLRAKVEPAEVAEAIADLSGIARGLKYEGFGGWAITVSEVEATVRSLAAEKAELQRRVEELEATCQRASGVHPSWVDQVAKLEAKLAAAEEERRRDAIELSNVKAISGERQGRIHELERELIRARAAKGGKSP